MWGLELTVERRRRYLARLAPALAFAIVLVGCSGGSSIPSGPVGATAQPSVSAAPSAPSPTPSAASTAVAAMTPSPSAAGSGSPAINPSAASSTSPPATATPVVSPAPTATATASPGMPIVVPTATPAPTSTPSKAPTSAPTPTPAASATANPIPNGKTLSASALVDSVGLNTHFSYGGTVYTSNEPAVVMAIEALNVKHIREGLLYPFSAQFATYRNAVQTLSAAGVRTDAGVQASDLTSPGFATEWATWFQSVGGLNWVEATEPPNECDLNNCLAQVPSYQQTLYAAIKAYAPSASVTVYGPSLTTLAADQQTGSLSQYLNTGNGHFYLLSQPPETTGICQISDACSSGAGTGSTIGNTYSLQTLLQDVSIVSGSKPIYNTEAGYCTTVTSGNTVVNDVPRDVQAQYWPRYLLHAFGDLGIPRTYIYDIADDGLSPPYFDQCGLIDNTATPKPAFLVLQTMLNALSDTSSPAAVPLAYQLSAPNNVDGTPPEAMAFSKSDGSYVVFVWNPVSVYYQQSGNGGASSHELTVAPISGTLTLGKKFSSATVTTFAPSTGAATVQSVSLAKPVALTITPMITMITLRP